MFVQILICSGLILKNLGIYYAQGHMLYAILQSKINTI